MSRYFTPLVLVLAFVSSQFSAPAKSPELREAGAALVDITPSYPIWLSGYVARKAESDGVAQRLYAKALALGSDAERPAILITVDNCGVPANVRDEVVKRLHQSRGIDPDRVAICSSHTHSAPWVVGFAPNIFCRPIPPDQMARVEKYTAELINWLVIVAERALDDRKPALLARALTKAGFAANRRTKGGPVDQELPVLLVSSPEGKVRAIFVSYACHCTTLGGDFNQACGDWAGYAQEQLQIEHPGAVALVALGCAADANPAPRGSVDLTKEHGREIASAVGKLAVSDFRPVTGKLVCRVKRFELAFDTLPTRAEWETRAKQTDYVGYHAKLNLARLDRGEKLPTKMPYIVQTWTFDDNLAMVFLAGEVVVDYSLRLKKEFDASRLWVNAYANDVPCYIPSERILKEGGYEGGGAMVYYDKPTRLAPGVEDQIVAAVHSILPKSFLAKP